MTTAEASGGDAKPHLKHPILFEDFFELGLSEDSSPFLTPESRKWGKNLSLKSAVLSAFFLFIAFILSFYKETESLSNVFLIAVYFFVGIPSLIESLEDLGQFDINIDVLMTFAAFASIFLGGALEGGLLLVLFALSGAMEETVTEKAKSAIGAIKKLAPSSAMVLLEDGRTSERAVKDIESGTLISIKSGQVIPLDGKVKEGFSTLDLAHLTGESEPQACRVGDEVPAGAQNLEGALVIEVLRTSNESTLARIIRLVTEAEEAKPKLERWFDRLSKGYAISVISLFVLFSLSFPFIFNLPFLGNEGSLYRSLAFLIAASPCALIIALPTAYLSAISASAKKGVLLKGGVKLDDLAECKGVAFDKTGTLTHGKLKMKGYKTLDEPSKFSEEFILSIARSLEQKALHPIARSIVQYAEDHHVLPYPIEDFHAIAGSGLTATAKKEGKVLSVAIGSISFIRTLLEDSQKDALEKASKDFEEEGLILAALKIEDEAILFYFEDEIRPGMADLLNELKNKFHLELFMLTGDHKKSAEKVAKAVGITHVFAGLKPEDKLQLISEKNAEMKIAMIGDGVNDAPALTRANVGIGMGKVGSNAAIQAADIVLLHDNLDMLGWLFAKAKKTKKIVIQNLSLALLAIIVASLLALGGIIPLWLAVVCHEGGTVLVGLNALRLLKD